MGLPMQKERIYQDGLKVKMESGNKNSLNKKPNDDNMNVQLKQEGGYADIPADYIGDYSDFEPLELTAEEKGILKSMRSLANKDNYEYGCAIVDGVVSKPFTSELNDKVLIPEDYMNGNKVLFFHAHTNSTLLSVSDFKLLIHENVEKVAVITNNNDVFAVSVGNGYRPDEDEFKEAVIEIREQANMSVMDQPGFFDWSLEQRTYMAIREQAFLIARRFGWKLEGGGFDAI